MPEAIVGRDAELASLRDFVGSVFDGASALVLQGEAGVGKTTLWKAGVAEAEDRGLRLLQALPAESETALSFSGIGDLLDPVLDEALAPLPVAQRRALALALVLEEVEGPPPDPHWSPQAPTRRATPTAAPRCTPRLPSSSTIRRRGGDTSRPLSRSRTKWSPPHSSRRRAELAPEALRARLLSYSTAHAS